MQREKLDDIQASIWITNTDTVRWRVGLSKGEKIIRNKTGSVRIGFRNKSLFFLDRYFILFYG